MVATIVRLNYNLSLYTVQIHMLTMTFKHSHAPQLPSSFEYESRRLLLNIEIRTCMLEQTEQIST